MLACTRSAVAMLSGLSGDALFRICVRCDISTLEKLSHTTLWLDIRKFAGDNWFWFSRVQSERQEALHWRPDVSWKDVQLTIDHMHSRIAISSQCASVSEFIEHFCLEEQTPSTKEFYIFQDCCLAGAASLVKEMLRSRQLPFQAEWFFSGHVFNSVCARGLVDVVRVLLEDGSIDPVQRDWRSLRDACMARETGVVNLLVRDKRYDWDWHKELVVGLALKTRDQGLLEVLAEKGLINWPVRPLWIVTAILVLLVCL